MNAASRRIQRTYLLLQLLHTLSASLVWGINTLLLLDAGLSNTEAFGANAAFTAGFVLFEVPTGIVADTRGRRASYLIGTMTLIAATLLYYLMWKMRAPFVPWALASLFIGLGFTFFSGAVEAWLVDALTETGFFREGGVLDAVLARGQIVEGAAMLGGSVAGGVIAQATSLGAPYAIRAGLLALTIVYAWRSMHDLGFTPSRVKSPVAEVKRVWRGAIEHGLGNPPVRWVMLAAPCTDGVLIYVFYAMQPYLLQLYGSEDAYSIAGLAAAIFAGAQIAGGLLVPYLRRLFRLRTSVILACLCVSLASLALIAALQEFWVAVTLLAFWGLVLSAMLPVRQAYIHALVPSAQRATVISFDSLLGSGGAAVVQPALGKVADVWSYPASFLVGAAIQTLALPFVVLARRRRVAADAIADGR